MSRQKPPVIAAYKPVLVQVEKGETYFWCSCGRSATQPFCDGSHKDTEFRPHRFVAERNAELLLCACKHTHKQPFCDGTHNNLLEKYEEAGEGDPVDVETVGYIAGQDGVLQAQLDDRCKVFRVRPDALTGRDGFAHCQLIGAGNGAVHLAQYWLSLQSGQHSPVLRTAGAEMVLYIYSGGGEAVISGRKFALQPETGVYIRTGEAVDLHCNGNDTLVATLSICPQGDLQIGGEMPQNFDDSAPTRTVEVDQQQSHAMADRFYQMLVDEAIGCEHTSQFLGNVPQSRAAHHRHLYEEAIQVLDGDGMMWTDNTNVPVQPGDIIFLPAKQLHSLEATEAKGMRLVGLFHPAGSPAVNY